MEKNLRNVLITVGLLALIGGVALFLVIRGIVSAGVTSVPDRMFGDQHLKTTVALIEMHKIRFGEYPESLKDLKFTGEWDQIALNSVSYTVSKDRTGYFVTVERGWMGKPSMVMPEGFWDGTGYRADLNPVLKPES